MWETGALNHLALREHTLSLTRSFKRSQSSRLLMEADCQDLIQHPLNVFTSSYLFVCMFVYYVHAHMHTNTHAYARMPRSTCILRLSFAQMSPSRITHFVPGFDSEKHSWLGPSFLLVRTGRLKAQAIWL